MLSFSIVRFTTLWNSASVIGLRARSWQAHELVEHFIAWAVWGPPVARREGIELARLELGLWQQRERRGLSVADVA